MKKCGQCKKSLDEEFFTRNGFERKVCNKCNEYAKLYYKKDRLDNSEKHKKYAQKYRQNNLEKIREKDRLSKKKYRQEHYDEYRKEYLEYRELYHNEILAKDRERMLNRPEYFLFSSARKRARERNLEFNITEQDVKYLLDNTPVCPLRKVNFERGSNGIRTYNSITLDRIDSTKGYIKDNIQIISYKANLVKNNIDLSLFKIIVEKLKTYKVKEHAIDNLTRNIILENRKSQNKYRTNFLENHLLSSANKRAKRKNIEFNIDEDYLKSIWPLDNRCPILGTKFIIGDGYMSPCSATIDRIDNDKGYIKNNIMIISAKVNVVKNNCTLEELEFILKNWEELEENRKNIICQV